MTRTRTRPHIEFLTDAATRSRAALSAIRILSAIAILLWASHAALAFDLREPTRLSPNRPSDLWYFLPIGYLFTIAIETPVLVLGLSRNLTFKQRFFAGLWLTACTYPIVILVLPIIFDSNSRATYLIVAETFAPVAECALFWLAFRGKMPPGAKTLIRNFAVIIVANLLSFGGGELMSAAGWFGLY